MNAHPIGTRLAYGAATAMIAVTALAGLTSCSNAPAATAGPNGSAAPAATAGGGIGASWAVEYRSLHDLKAHSAVAVQGRFTGIVVQSVLKTLPITDFEFTVETVLHDPGNLVAAGDKLTVRQTGGTVDGVVQQTSDDPLFTIGENNVLFLARPSPGIFYVIGGPTGRFEITNGQVSPHAPDGATFSGTPADFAAAVDAS